MEIIFIPSRVGLTVKFTNLTKVPSDNTISWDFGDGSDKSDQKNPTHTYKESGFFEVTLTVIPPEAGGESKSLTQTIALTENAKTSLGGSIYYLIDNYIPKGLVGDMAFSYKRLYIEKWQLYIQPLVNHEVTIEEYNNELSYEALENQLIMELSAYDYLTNAITNLIQSKSSTTSSSSETIVGDTADNVKKIITGPSEVEFYDSKVTDADIVTAAVKAIQPGGVLDMLRKNLCTLAERLEIYIPFCTKVTNRVIPEMTNTNIDRPFRGPNPRLPVK